jgi:hypothetical protein
MSLESSQVQVLLEQLKEAELLCGKQQLKDGD